MAIADGDMEIRGDGSRTPFAVYTIDREFLVLRHDDGTEVRRADVTNAPEAIRGRILRGMLRGANAGGSVSTVTVPGEVVQ